MSNQGEPGEHAYLTRKLRRAIASEATGVRRLTPRECERLQALPDDWTNHGPDSRRYAALGDAVTATVAEWIGRRIIAQGGTSPARSGPSHRKERTQSAVQPPHSPHS